MAFALVALLTPVIPPSVPRPQAASTSVSAAQPGGEPSARPQGDTRILVELRLPGGADVRAIAEAQHEVLARLGQSRVTVVRRYRSLPLLALEVDAEALAKLSQMDDLVTRVTLDSLSRPQEDR